jgi:hypothetical protein
MTWVIGASTFFGYGIIISDIRVTWPDGTTMDILQKIYPVGKFIVAGFAGSVELGFMLLQNLKTFLKLPKDEKNTAWRPDWVAENWSPIAKKIYEKTRRELQEGKSEIIMVGVSPNEDVGVPGWAQIYVSVFKSPDFEANIVHGANNILSIGSGSGVKPYVELLREFTEDDYHPLMQMEVGNPGGWGQVILLELSNLLRENPEKSISEHVQIFLLRRGQILEGNNDSTFYPHDKDPIKIVMPKVARGYPEFVRMVQQINILVKGTIC